MAKINKKELVDFFLMESAEHFEAIQNGLLVLERDPGNWSVIDELFRSAHTIKGSAAMVGFKNVAHIAHSLEDTLDQLRKGNITPEEKLVTFLLDFVEKFNGLINKNKRDLNEQETEDFDKILEENITSEQKQQESTEQSDESSAGKEGSETPEQTELPEEKTQRVESATRKAILENADEKYNKTLDTSYSDEFIRIRLERLDNLLNLVGELITNKNRQTDRVHALKNLGVDLEYTKNRLMNIIKEFEEKYAYSMENLREMPAEDSTFADFSETEFDRYDDFNIFSRRLAEIGNDIVTIINDILTNFTYFTEETDYIGKITDSLQRNLTDIRMVPVDRLFNIALRTVRTASISENKLVNINLSGESIELDKSLIDALNEVIIHIIRNAVSHGIEDRKTRKKYGKNEEGIINLSASRESNIIVFEISDDGEGIDPAKLKDKAVELGILARYDADNMRADKVMDLIFHPGFSTKADAGDVSGRGVGLDAVKKKIESLGGSIYVNSEKGKGTTFVLNVPITLLIADYLVLRENKQLFSIPIIGVHETFEIHPDEIRKIGNHFFYEVRGDIYEIHDLGTLIKQTSQASFKEGNIGILVDGPRKSYVLTVDELIGRETAVTKKMGRFLSGLSYFAGANIGPQGEVRFIIDTIKLMETKSGTITYKRDTGSEKKTKGINYISNSILVVDDSISVRKYLKKLLSDEYYVDEAVDGVDALRKLETKRYDLVITDLEMPSMNGYELIEHIRTIKGDNLTHIFVLTSRATEKHRMKAMELGANEFIIKPIREQSIMNKVKGVMIERANV
ncbi:hybrid sensor histidine kinase/response regulator [Flexistipes sinusarabici]|uniref:hybrid sensor histidine kinase/response regulator n=1 Tax=Flexistipes sinusarabici TaxID=2352 RepID=UPI002356E47F|nr:hybrid sensor histidine kinase/response regulator [Flexistipes sinusarabici]